MRFKSSETDGFQVIAVTGVNTISFGIDATDAARANLLGFSVDRRGPHDAEPRNMYSYKVFKSIVPNPGPDLRVWSKDHPIQSFQWDDFTAWPNTVYEYAFRPLRGTPGNLDRSAQPIGIRVKTEPLYTDDDHDVFFNRGVASSQAFERRFPEVKKIPDDLTAERLDEVLDWLTRGLLHAMLEFIAGVGSDDTLLCCFYEFRHERVLKALARASTRVRELKIIIDAKDNGYTDKRGAVHESFPRTDNLDAIAKAGIPASCIVERRSNPSDIQHNKFMVLLKGAERVPAAVWTGSTNVSLGGLTGQTNVGHWVHDPAVAADFKRYWDLLASDPGSSKDDDVATARRKKREYREAVAALVNVPTKLTDIPPGTTVVFSPRPGLKVLDLYVDLVDKADDLTCVTLAFGINKRFKDQLKDNTAQSHLTFMLLEQKDAPRRTGETAFVAINASNNVYKAWGSYIKEPVYRWVKETNARFLELNRHVSYVHSKFLLRDPLGEDPIVVTGSANFSEASTNGNDENMIIVRGNQRVADIYFTEFNRLFNHYYFRSVLESTGGIESAGPQAPAGEAPAGEGSGGGASAGQAPAQDSELFLRETAEEWLQKYEPGKLKAKRLRVYTEMKGFTSV